MKIMLVEPLHEGHHMNFLRFAIRELSSSRCHLSLITRRSVVTSPGYQLVKKEMSKNVKTYFIPELKKNYSLSSLSILRRQFREWFILRYKFLKLIKTNKPDLIYVPDLEWIAKAVEIFGSPFGKVPFVALYMSPKFHRKTMGLGHPSRYDWIYSILFKRLLKISSLKNLIVMDKFFYKFTKKRYKNLFYKIKFAPDFASNKKKFLKKNSRLNLGIPISSKVILVYGALDLKKGIQELLLSLSNKDIPNNLVILLAGQPSKEILKLMKNKEIKKFVKTKKIITFFKYHNLIEEQKVFEATDAVWLGYTQGFLGSSGVMYQAIHFDLPIIGQNKGIIGHYIKQYKLGISIQPNETKKVVKAICDLFKNINFYGKNNINRKSLKNYHSPDTHFNILIDCLNNFKNY